MTDIPDGSIDIQENAKMSKEQNGNAPVERNVIRHRWRTNEGGYRLCLDCGTAEHNRPFEGFIYWFAGVGYISDPGCRVSV
jgi:hypothetical protein